jgi:hypothetical protein
MRFRDSGVAIPVIVQVTLQVQDRISRPASRKSRLGLYWLLEHRSQAHPTQKVSTPSPTTSACAQRSIAMNRLSTVSTATKLMLLRPCRCRATQPI